MKREIKFRAWNSVIKLMEPWDQIKTELNQCLITKYIKVMQYTNLKDKNGKEIYEGDIVLTDMGRNKIIEWHENGFYLNGILHSQFDGEELEVIGNIYENPDLLSTNLSI